MTVLVDEKMYTMKECNWCVCDDAGLRFVIIVPKLVEYLRDRRIKVS